MAALSRGPRFDMWISKGAAKGSADKAPSGQLHAFRIGDGGLCAP
jgi:hypothetical protein